MPARNPIKAKNASDTHSNHLKIWLTTTVKGTQVMSPLISAVLTPPRKSSEPAVENLKPNIGESTAPSEMRFRNVGFALYLDKDSKAMPIRPSGGKSGASKPALYWVAAPSVWQLAYGERVSAL